MSDPPKRPGRPALDPSDPSVPVSFSLPSKQFAAASEKAKHDRMTVQDWIRRVVSDAAARQIITKK